MYGTIAILIISGSFQAPADDKAKGQAEAVLAAAGRHLITAHVARVPAVDGAKVQAEDVLNAAGLQFMPRAGSYIIEAEVAARHCVEVAEIKALARDRRAGDIKVLETNYAAEKAQAKVYLDRANKFQDEADDEARKEKPDRAEVIRLTNEANAEAAKAEPHHQQMAEIQAKAAVVRREVADLQGEVDVAKQENRVLTGQAMQTYAMLSRNRRVLDALRVINKGERPKRAIGPIEMHGPNIVAAMDDTLSQLGFVRVPNRKLGDLYHLAEETEFIKRLKAAVNLSREIGMHEARKSGKAPAADATKKAAAPMTPISENALEAKKADLAARVVTLRREAKELDARRAKLIADPETLDAVEEINRVRRPKIRIAPKPGYSRSIKDLEALERPI